MYRPDPSDTAAPRRVVSRQRFSTSELNSLLFIPGGQVGLLQKYPSIVDRARLCSVDLARNTRGAQPNLGYQSPSGPNTLRRNPAGSSERNRSSHMCMLYRR